MIFSVISYAFYIAHLIRELKYLAGLTDKSTADYGQKLLDAMRDMFSIFHKAEELTEKAFAEAMVEWTSRLLSGLRREQ